MDALAVQGYALKEWCQAVADFKARAHQSAGADKVLEAAMQMTIFRIREARQPASQPASQAAASQPARAKAATTNWNQQWCKLANLLEQTGQPTGTNWSTNWNYHPPLLGVFWGNLMGGLAASAAWLSLPFSADSAAWLSLPFSSCLGSLALLAAAEPCCCADVRTGGVDDGAAALRRMELLAFVFPFQVCWPAPRRGLGRFIAVGPSFEGATPPPCPSLPRRRHAFACRRRALNAR